MLPRFSAVSGVSPNDHQVEPVAVDSGVVPMHASASGGSPKHDSSGGAPSSSSGVSPGPAMGQQVHENIQSVAELKGEELPDVPAVVDLVEDDVPADAPVMRRPAAVRRGTKQRQRVLSGDAPKTKHGLDVHDLRKTARGRVVSKRVPDRSKLAYEGSVMQKWNVATRRAKETWGMIGYVPCGGATPDGQRLLETVRAIRRMEGW